MRKIPLMVISVLTLLFTGAFATQAPDPAPAEARIQHVHQELIQGFLHRDVAALDRVLADDYVFTGDEGRFVGKQHIIESFRSGDHRMYSFDISRQRIRIYGDAAVMTYRYSCRQTYKNQDVSGVFRITRVFARKNGRWQLVAGHESRIRSAPAP